MDRSDASQRLIDSGTRGLFLQRATSIEDWNARAAFLELLHIPTHEDIEAYCRGHFVERWKLSPGGGFYWHCEATSQTDYLTIHSKEEVCDIYRKQVERLTERVSSFRGDSGKLKLIELAWSPVLEDEQKVLLMLDYRAEEGIPTKEPVDLNQGGRLVFGYRRSRLFRGENVLLQAAGLV